jgi:hypothetical protein
MGAKFLKSILGSLPRIFLIKSICSGWVKAVEDMSAMENMQRSNTREDTKSGLECH